MGPTSDFYDPGGTIEYTRVQESIPPSGSCCIISHYYYVLLCYRVEIYQNIILIYEIKLYKASNIYYLFI
jgi:hypothetical protein